METLALLAATIGIVAAGMGIAQSKQSMPVKAVVLGLLSWILVFTWNGYLSGHVNSDHGILITIFTAVGVATACTYLWPHLPNDGAKAAAVFGAIILIAFAGYPTFMGKLPQPAPSPQPTISSMPTSPSTPRVKSTSQKKKTQPSKEDCEKMTYSVKEAMGCPKE